MMTRREFMQMSGMAAAAHALPKVEPGAADISIEIAPYLLEASPKHRFQTVAYNGQVPGPLIRMRQGREISVEVRNRTPAPELLHWHGLYLPPEVDGAMEEGTPMIAPGATTRYSFTPDPAGFRWYHTHTFAGKDLHKAQYGGQHGFLLIEPKDNPAAYDREVFLALHDWGGHMDGGDDGFMMPSYEVSTINGKMLGFGEPVRVKQGERVMLHVLNSSPTEVHWVALAGHTFQVVALDGNTVQQPQRLQMLRLAPAERVSATVEMNAPGVWVMGEVRKHIQAAGMGVVFEYAGAVGKPSWTQPEDLVWEYEQFATRSPLDSTVEPGAEQAVEEIALTFDAKFMGHGAEEEWRINGKSYPHTDEPLLHEGRRYRLAMKNESADEHPIHLHRHTFEVKRIGDGPELSGLRKDVLLIPAQKTSTIEFVANHPGRTLLHCHQQDHMNRGFMMVFRYAYGMSRRLLAGAVLLASGIAGSGVGRAQGNYEIQVYGAETVAPKNLMVELHSNFTPDGQIHTIDGVYPTNHQEHETLELTEGLTEWSEVGFYVFTSEQAGHGVQWVGDHIRPRVRVPPSWHWPVGVSLSTEIGYQRAVYSPDTWTWEIRPIIDKQIGRWYLAFNPALERTWHGPDVNQGLGFSPGAKAGYDFTKKINAGFEYYADYCSITSPCGVHYQQQQIFAVTDLNLAPEWEVNIGVGIGPTASTDHLIVKGILGRRFNWGGKKSAVE